MQPYQVTHQNGRTEFHPTRSFALFLASSLALGAIFCATLGAWFLTVNAGEWPALLVGCTFCLGAIVLTIVAITAWRTRSTILSVCPIDGVTYGTRKLCAGGEVQYVAIIPARGGERGDWEVVFGLNADRQVEIPSQYFGSYNSTTLAQPFAEQLAQALSVPVRNQV